jgi:hypothetical protein
MFTQPWLRKSHDLSLYRSFCVTTDKPIDKIRDVLLAVQPLNRVLEVPRCPPKYSLLKGFDSSVCSLAFSLRHNSYYASRISTLAGMIYLKDSVDTPAFAVIR